MYNAKKHTPWGYADTVTEIAPGITLYTTPGHGGYHVSAERYKAMPAQYRACSFTKDQWFEEDCSWCAVVLSWPGLFAPEMVDAAKVCYEVVYARRVA